MGKSPQFTTDPPRLIGSRDAATGQVYFPARALAADGSLRETEQVTLSPRGTLYSWTFFAGATYGQVDLPDGVRIQGLLLDKSPDIGAEYEVVIQSDEAGNQDWRFARV